MKEDKNSRQKIGQERRWRVEDGKDTGREWKIRRGGVGSLEFHDRRTMSAMQVCPSMHRVCMGGTMVGLCCPGQRSTIHANKNEMTKEITINAKKSICTHCKVQGLQKRYNTVHNTLDCYGYGST